MGTGVRVRGQDKQGGGCLNRGQQGHEEFPGEFRLRIRHEVLPREPPWP